MFIIFFFNSRNETITIIILYHALFTNQNVLQVKNILFIYLTKYFVYRKSRFLKFNVQATIKNE